MFNVNEFKHQFANNGGGQLTTLFSVSMPVPRGLVGGLGIGEQNRLRFYCEATTLPGTHLATTDINRYGYGTTEKKPFVSLVAPIDTRFLVDGKGAVWSYFMTWMNYIINFDTSGGMLNNSGHIRGVNSDPYDVEYIDNYAVDMNIQLYNPAGVMTTEIVLLHAYPIFMGDIPLHWGDKNQIARLPVRISYCEWYSRRVQSNGEIPIRNLQESYNLVNALNIGTNTVGIAPTSQNYINEITGFLTGVISV